MITPETATLTDLTYRALYDYVTAESILGSHDYDQIRYPANLHWTLNPEQLTKLRENNAVASDDDELSAMLVRYAVFAIDIYENWDWFWNLVDDAPLASPDKTAEDIIYTALRADSTLDALGVHTSGNQEAIDALRDLVYNLHAIAPFAEPLGADTAGEMGAIVRFLLDNSTDGSATVCRLNSYAMGINLLAHELENPGLLAPRTQKVMQHVSERLCDECQTFLTETYTKLKALLAEEAIEQEN